jgi:hypothetical protein
VAGFKDFNDGNTLTAAEVDGYLMQQAVMRFPTTAALVAALGAGIRTGGMLAWADSTSTLYWYEGSGVWTPVESLWKAWNTTWSGSTTAPSLGNGSSQGQWRISGGMVEGHTKVTLGTTSNAGTGSNYTFTLPAAVSAFQQLGACIGAGAVYDASAGTILPRQAVTIGSTTVVVLANEAGTRVGTSTIAWASTDQMNLSVRYRPDGLDIS